MSSWSLCRTPAFLPSSRISIRLAPARPQPQEGKGPELGRRVLQVQKGAEHRLLPVEIGRLGPGEKKADLLPQAKPLRKGAARQQALRQGLLAGHHLGGRPAGGAGPDAAADRKSTRLNSSH